jgi:hypothetical protein
MRNIEDTLGLWVSGLLTAQDVTEWAGCEIARLDDAPAELIDLAIDGPQVCLKRAQCEFPPRAAKLGYLDEFAVRAVALDLSAEGAVRRFADWASRACMGEDLSDSLVVLGYHLDHLLCDGQDEGAAVKLLRAELPNLLPRCLRMARRYSCIDQGATDGEVARDNKV